MQLFAQFRDFRQTGKLRRQNINFYQSPHFWTEVQKENHCEIVTCFVEFFDNFSSFFLPHIPKDGIPICAVRVDCDG